MLAGSFRFARLKIWAEVHAEVRILQVETSSRTLANFARTRLRRCVPIKNATKHNAKIEWLSEAPKYCQNGACAPG